jgi:hypothetical protein
MAQTLISPKQSNPSAATLTEIYDCPDSTTFVGRLNICNRSATATAFRVSIEIDNAATDNAQFLAYDTPIEGNQVVSIDAITMTADDRLMVYATLATLSFSLMGVENA